MEKIEYDLHISIVALHGSACIEINLRYWLSMYFCVITRGSVCVEIYAKSLFYNSSIDDDITEDAVVIGLHMIPYLWERGKISKRKIEYMIRMWGVDSTLKVMKLHYADIMAH